MNVYRRAFVLAGAVTLCAASCSDGGERPRALGQPDGGRDAGTGGTGAASGSGGAAGAGEAGTSGMSGMSGMAGAAAGATGAAGAEPDAGTAGDGGEDAGPEPDAGPPAPPRCAVGPSAYTVLEPVPELNTGGDEVPLAITPDELSIVVRRSIGQELRLVLADRDNAAHPFTPRFQALPDGYDAVGGAALSPDGLTLVLVSSDARRLGQLSRASRGDDFAAEIDEAPFGSLNTLSVYTGNHYSSPVLTADGARLYFNAFSPGSSLIRFADVSGGFFSDPMPEDAFWFAGSGDERKLPTAVSSDLRTLFYFDEAESRQAAIWRMSTAAAFDDNQVAGGWRGALPNEACDAIYTSIDGDVVRVRPQGTAPDAGAAGSSGAGGSAGAGD